MLSILGRFSEHLDNKVRNKGVVPEDGLKYIHEKLFCGTILVTLLFGLIAFAIGFTLAIVEKVWSVAAIDLFAYSGVVFMYFDNRLKTKIKVKLLLFILYALAIVLIIELGPFGAGILWLVAYSIIASVFGGIKAAKRSILINMLTLFILGALTKFNVLDIPFFNEYNFYYWAGIAVNLFVVNILSSILVAYFIDGMKESLLKEKDLKQRLKRKSERLIQAKIKAEEADQLKSSFLANVSHEFRTPMNAIIGFTEIMLYANPLEEKRKRYLENIQKSSEQLLHIINNTIEYSKIERGSIDLVSVKVNIYEIFQTLYERLEPKCPSGVEFLFNIPEGNENDVIYTDKEKLFQILLNLILNAFKFTEKGSIRYGCIESEHNGFFKFFVSDTGIGIRKERQKDIFTKFHKEDEFMEGTGLGLSISATLIAYLGGRIWLESETNRGTDFYFILPKKLVLKGSDNLD